MSRGRILAVDHGEKRIGLAVSDALGYTVQPLRVLERTGGRKDVSRLAALAREHEAVAVVFGLPLTMSGEEGEAARTVRTFAADLSRQLPGMPIEFWDERLTTVEAERMLIEQDVKRRRRRERIDGLAATLILQSYLDAHPASASSSP